MGTSSLNLAWNPSLLTSDSPFIQTTGLTLDGSSALTTNFTGSTSPSYKFDFTGGTIAPSFTGDFTGSLGLGMGMGLTSGFNNFSTQYGAGLGFGYPFSGGFDYYKYQKEQEEAQRKQQEALKKQQEEQAAADRKAAIDRVNAANKEAQTAQKNLDAEEKKQNVKPTSSKNKLGVWEGLGHFGLGIAKSPLKMFGVEWDIKGKFKFDWKKCLTTVGTIAGTAVLAAGVVALGIVSAPVVTGALVIAGIAGSAMIVTQGIKGASIAFDKTKTKEERLKGCEDAGDAVGQVGMAILLKKWANFKNANKAKDLAKDLEMMVSTSKSKNINMNRDLITEEIEALRNSGGNSRKMRNALEGINDLTKPNNPKNWPSGLNKRVNSELENMGCISKGTPLVNDAKFAKAMNKDAIIAELNNIKSKDPDTIQAIIDQINNATDRGTILKAINEAKNLAKGNRITYLLDKAEDVLKVNFGTLLKSAGSNIINTPVKTFNSIKNNPTQAVFTGYMGSRVIGLTAEQDAEMKKEVAENKKIEDGKKKIVDLKKKLTEKNGKLVESLQGLVSIYNNQQTLESKKINFADLIEDIDKEKDEEKIMAKISKIKEDIYKKIA